MRSALRETPATTGTGLDLEDYESYALESRFDGTAATPLVGASLRLVGGVEDRIGVEGGGFRMNSAGRGAGLALTLRRGLSMDTLRILFLGDIVGEPGRKAVIGGLAEWREREQIDFVVANGENAAGGRRITPNAPPPARSLSLAPEVWSRPSRKAIHSII